MSARRPKNHPPAAADSIPRPTSAADALLDGAPGRLVRLAQATSWAERGLRRALSHYLQALPLSDAELLVLCACARQRGEGVVQNQLAEEVGISPAQASNLLDGLRRRRLVASRRAEEDRRRQLWHLETEGEQLLSAAQTQIGGLAAAVVQGLTPADQVVLERLLATVRSAAEQARADSAGQAAACRPAGSVRNAKKDREAA